MGEEKTKDKILKESLKLFAKNGFEAVSVESIAKAVGIKAPSLYKHFENKNEILEKIFERANAADEEKAQELDMPEENGVNSGSLSFGQIKEFSKEMLRHWTDDEFFCNFRRLLTVRQYKSEKDMELYNQYISAGPVKYMAEIFLSQGIEERKAKFYASEFYGIMHLFYSLYDSGEKIEDLLIMLDEHMESFERNFL